MARTASTPAKKISTRAKNSAIKLVQKYDPIQKWSESINEKVTEPAFQRDPAFIAKLLPLMEMLGKYFDGEVRGFENIPAKGPMLLVGNHSGGVLTPDTSVFFAAWYRNRGLDDPLVGLAFDAAFAIPGFTDLMRRIGEVPASHKNAARALELGNSVLVYPGGTHEVFRPWTDRNKIDFGGRKGFIKLALKHGVPVVPIVGHGGHETTVVLTRGEKAAKLFKFDRLRMNAYPLLFQIPWGISTPAFPGFPLPAKITVQIRPPLDWSRFGPEGADDPKVLQQCYDEITGAMQSTLMQLAEETPNPIATRLKSFVRNKKR